MKEKINKILWDFAQSKLTQDEATQQVLDLFGVVGRSELLLDFCYWLNANRFKDIKDFLDIEEVEDYLKSSNNH